ncbi:MAG: methylaspartate ammonia-lyase [Clostridia bacterium]|nr:methylaspartate ammonia-lyase [Clostridia bacterium]
MKIVKVVCSPGRTGFYFDDQRAIKKGAHADGAAYVGQPVTEGFTQIRQAGESIGVMLVLENGAVARGDCAAVQYSGAGGRDPLFLAESFIPLIEKDVAAHLVGQELDSFRRLAEEIDHMQVDGKRLHTAIRYGVSQAILDAVAQAQGLNMCDVVAKEYGTKVQETPLDVFTQSGDDRYLNADKMIMKGAAVLPHGLFNSVAKTGEKGEKLREYVAWLRDRIIQLRPREDYNPIMHIDCYGTIGLIFGNSNYEDMANYLATLEEAAKPFQLRIEGPMDSEERTAQMTDLRELRKVVDAKGINVELVADEWCNTLEDVIYFADNKAGHMVQIKTPDLGSIHNTIEAVLYCRNCGMGAYQGGTCNETDRSAQVCTQIAMATHPVQILAKPGMGVDEGYMIVYNEMHRVLALRKAGIGVWKE